MFAPALGRNRAVRQMRPCLLQGIKVRRGRDNKGVDTYFFWNLLSEFNPSVN